MAYPNGTTILNSNDFQISIDKHFQVNYQLKSPLSPRPLRTAWLPSLQPDNRVLGRRDAIKGVSVVVFLVFCQFFSYILASLEAQSL